MVVGGRMLVGGITCILRLDCFYAPMSELTGVSSLSELCSLCIIFVRHCSWETFRYMHPG